MTNSTKSIPPSVSITVWLSFLVLTLAWGSSFILMKRGLDSFSPYQVASLRMVSALIAMGGLAIFHVKHIPKEKLKYVFLSGVMSMFIPAFLFCIAETGISSSVAGVLNALTPAFAFISGLLFFNQKSKTMQLVGLVIGFIGTSVLILVNAKGSFDLNGYAFCVVAATALYGYNVNMLKKHLSGVNPWHLTTVSVSIAGLLALPYLLSTNWLDIIREAPKGKESLLAAVVLGVIGTAFAQAVFNRMLQHASAVFASSITYFIPIVAVMWGVWDGEVLLFWHYIGMVGIIVGILILNKAK